MALDRSLVQAEAFNEAAAARFPTKSDKALLMSSLLAHTHGPDDELAKICAETVVRILQTEDPRDYLPAQYWADWRALDHDLGGVVMQLALGTIAANAAPGGTDHKIAYAALTDGISSQHYKTAAQAVHLLAGLDAPDQAALNRAIYVLDRDFTLRMAMHASKTNTPEDYSDIYRVRLAKVAKPVVESTPAP